MSDDKVRKVLKKSWGIAKSTAGAGKSVARRLTPGAKKAGQQTMKATTYVAGKTSNAVHVGFHRVMGSNEYTRQAEDVNRRLTEALRTLEDSIRRRDRDIASLRAHIAKLEAQLQGRHGGQ